MKVAHTSTTSTEPAQVSPLPRRNPGASGHQPAPTFTVPGPRTPIPHDLPAPAGSPLAELRAHIDAWDHIPTARTAAGSYTRASLTAAIANASQDEPRIPAFDDAWGRPSAWAAFGDGAA